MLGRVDHALAALGRPELGHRHLFGRGEAGGQPPGGLPRREPHGLGVDVRVGGALADRLERGDRAVELLPRLRVLGREAERLLAHADGDRAQPGRRAFDDPLDDRAAALRIADDVVVTNLDIGQLDARLRNAAGGVLTVAPHAGRAGVDEEQSDRALARAGGHEHAVGHQPGGNAHLHAIEAPPSTVAPCGGRRLGGLAGELHEGGGEHPLPRCHRRQLALLLRARAELDDRQRAHHERRQRRHRRHAAPHLLEQQTQLEESEPAAADRLGQGDPEQVGRGQPRPRVAVEPLAAGLHLLQPLLGDLPLEHLQGRVADRLLLLREPEVHDRPPIASPSACRGRRRR